MPDKKNPSLPPSKTGGPVVKTGPTSGQNRTRNDDGRWRAKRSDAGKPREKKSGCFLTTAACEHQGRSDDCAELMVLRSFRDTYLMQSSEGRDLVDQYYSLAPALAASMTREQADGVWSVVMQCVSLIEASDPASAVHVYRSMVIELQHGRVPGPRS